MGDHSTGLVCGRPQTTASKCAALGSLKILDLNLKKQKTRHIILVVLAGHIVFFALQIPRWFFNTGTPAGWDWWFPVRIAWATGAELLLTPLILLAGYYLRVHRQKLWRNLGLHLLLATILGLIDHFVFHCGLVALDLGHTEIYRANILNGNTIFYGLPLQIVRYAMIVATQQAYLYFQESQERAALLRESEMQILKMQLEPHFFFNTLNAISALTHRAPEEASRLIAQLGDMLRISLQKDKAPEVPLKEEMEFLEAFLHIHKTLMGRRLKIEWRIDPETLDASVPNMLLQPIVENAIKHGIAPLEAGGTVIISSFRQNEDLILEVRDDGCGLTANGPTSGRVGLSNTRARLANLYNGSHEISVMAGTGSGAIVRIRIPFRERRLGARDEDPYC